MNRICYTVLTILKFQFFVTEAAAQEYGIILDTLHMERALVISKGDNQPPFVVIPWEECSINDVSEFIEENCKSFDTKGGLARWYILNDRVRFHAHLLSNEIRVRINSKELELNEYSRNCEIYFKIIDKVALAYFEITLESYKKLVLDGPTFEGWDPIIKSLKYAQILDYSEIQ